MRGKPISTPVAIAIVFGGGFLLFALSHYFGLSSPADIAFRHVP